MLRHLITFLLVNQAFASTAQISFVAQTNMPGVVVEGEAKNISTQYNPSAISGSSIEIDVFDLKTGMDKRDEHLREKVFSAKSLGEVKIKFTAKEKNCGADRCHIIGVLDIKGKQKEISLPLDEKNSISGVVDISLTEFSLPRPGFMGVKVEDSVKIHFKLTE